MPHNKMGGGMAGIDGRLRRGGQNLGRGPNLLHQEQEAESDSRAKHNGPLKNSCARRPLFVRYLLMR